MKDSKKQAKIAHFFVVMFLILSAVATSFLIGFSSAQVLAQGQSGGMPLSAPERLAVAVIDAGHVELSWQDDNDSEQGFKIERSDDRLFTGKVANFTAESNSISFIDSTTDPLTVYYYRVLAFDSQGESAWSNIAILLTPDIVPSQPGAMIVSSPKAFAVNLSWTDNSNNESGFRVERAIDEAFTKNVTSFLTRSNVYVCQDTMVPKGNYYYRVVAYNDSGDSEPSDSASIRVDDQIVEDKILMFNDTDNVTLSGFVPIFVPFVIDAKGSVLGTSGINLRTEDASVTFSIPRGQKMLNLNGHALLDLNYRVPTIIPQPPEGRTVVSACEFGPSYSSFSPGIKMTFKFDPASISPGLTAANLEIGSWDGHNWEIIEGSTVNPETSEISATISHFSIVAILAAIPPEPDQFSASDLLVFPQYSNEGELVRIQVDAKNSGPVPGNYELVLILNGEVEESRYVAIEPETQYTEMFEVKGKGAGYYAVLLNGLKDFFVVERETQASSITQSPTPTTSIALPTYSVSTPEPGFIPAKVNTTLIVIIGSAVVVIILGTLGIVLFRKK